MASCGSQSHLVGALSGSLCNLKVGSLNCRGLCNKVKRTELYDYLKKSGLTFIFLQETKFSPFKHKEYEEDWHNSMIFLNSVRGGKCGTGILCNSPSVKILNKLTDNEGCILVMDRGGYSDFLKCLVPGTCCKYGPDLCLKIMKNRLKRRKMTLLVLLVPGFEQKRPKIPGNYSPGLCKNIHPWLSPP